MNQNIFREYDIRGKYPEEINEESVFKIGSGYGSYIKEKFNQTKCVVSMDNRLSSPSLKENFINGVISTGVDVVDCGLTTTPMNFYARHKLNLFGAMITASHNPKCDNGIKFSFGGPSNAKGKEIYDFQKYVNKSKFIKGNGKISTKDISKKYIDFLHSGINMGNKAIKVVLDPGNGVTANFVNEVFKNEKINLVVINEISDGNFPNHHPDPADKKNLRQLQKAVIKHKADIGIAFDGDGDRVGVVKNDGSCMSTEELMIIAIRSMIDKVKNKKFLYDVKCSKCLEDEIKKLGGTPYLFKTGASYTQNEVHKKDLPFGGEYSGHIFFRDRIFDVGSAMYGALRIIECLSKSDENTVELTKDIVKYHTSEEIKIKTTDEHKKIIVEKMKTYALNKNFEFSTIDGVKIFFIEGWVLVRASNTGPNLILRVEADTEDNMIKLKNFFENKINEANIF